MSLDVFTSGQFQNHHLVQRWHGFEVEAVQAFDGGELSQPDPPLNHPTFPVDQLEFGQSNEIAHMINTLGGTLAGQFVVFPEEGGQPESFQVMG
jgi:hypothetical protein